MLPDSSKHYPITIERVREIKSLNAQGIRPEDLGAVEVVSNKPREAEPEFVDVVGQFSVKALDKKEKEKKRRQQQQQNPNRPQQRGSQGQQKQQGNNTGQQNQNRQTRTEGNKGQNQNQNTNPNRGK
jgi:hypothetical protein